MNNDSNSKQILWKDIKIGNELLDGSKVTQIHDIHTANCVNIKNKNEDLTISEDHLILCDISKFPIRVKNTLYNNIKNISIPLEEDIIIGVDNLNIEDINDKANLDRIYREYLEGNYSGCDAVNVVTKTESKIFDRKKNLVWLTGLEIYQFMYSGYKVIGYNSGLIESCNFVGEYECFCISTDTGKYNTNGNGFISHNSVTIRNIILHCLTHGINIGLVDVKLTEFECYKGCRNVIGVANSPAEAVELLRLARQLMYKRNADLAKAGVQDLVDYKPKKITDKISVFGREYKDSETLTIRENGEERQITFSELLELVNK